MYFGQLVPDHSANPQKTKIVHNMLTFPSQQQLVRQSLWGDIQHLFISNSHLAKPAWTLILTRCSSVIWHARCIVQLPCESLEQHVLLSHCPEPSPVTCQPLCQVTSSVFWASTLTIQLAQDDFCHCRREPVLAPSEKMPMLAGKIKLSPNYTSATGALSFPLTQVLIAPGSLLRWNILVEASVGEQVPQI